MKGSTRFAVALLCAQLSLWVLASPAVAQTARDVQQAEAEFSLGIRAFEEGKYPDALSRMTRAFALAPNYRTAAGLGQVELHLGDFRAAAEHLDFSLRNFPTGGETEGRTRVMDGLAEARAHVFTLAIRSDVSGAEITVDGKVVGFTPFNHDLYLEPGEPVVLVTASGFEPFREEVYAPAGAQKELAVVLKRAEGFTPTEPTPSANPHAWWVVGVGGGVALAAAGTGLMLWVDAKRLDERASSLAVELVRSRTRCDSSNVPSECSRLANLREDAEARTGQATALWASAAAVSLATATVFAFVELSAPQAGPVSDVSVSPVVLPRIAGLNLRGRF